MYLLYLTKSELFSVQNAIYDRITHLAKREDKKVDTAMIVRDKIDDILEKEADNTSNYSIYHPLNDNWRTVAPKLGTIAYVCYYKPIEKGFDVREAKYTKLGWIDTTNLTIIAINNVLGWQ